jgi:hypothetical protein
MKSIKLLICYIIDLQKKHVKSNPTWKFSISNNYSWIYINEKGDEK